MLVESGVPDAKIFVSAIHANDDLAIFPFQIHVPSQPPQPHHPLN